MSQKLKINVILRFLGIYFMYEKGNKYHFQILKIVKGVRAWTNLTYRGRPTSN